MNRLHYFIALCSAEFVYYISFKLMLLAPSWWNTPFLITAVGAVLLLRKSTIARLKNAGLKSVFILVLDVALIAYFMPKSLLDWGATIVWKYELGGIFDKLVVWSFSLNEQMPHAIRVFEFPDLVMEIFGWISTLGLALIIYLLLAHPRKRNENGTEKVAGKI